jgi:hypothetical protein
MLIVIGIVLLVALIALPAFKALSGSNSTETAYNQLSGLLGRARAEAVGLQQIRGIAFFIDRETQQMQAVQVKQTEYPATGLPPIPPDVYLDYVEDRDPVLMPRGVGLQMVDDCALTGTSRNDDGYIGLNTPGNVNGVPFTYGGVILFDGYGRIVSKTYGFKFATDAGKPTNAAKAWYMTGTLTNYAPPGPPRSQFGFVVYDADAFANLGHTPDDPQIRGVAYTATERAEETWLDENGTPILVNRNNGTLVKGK